MPRHQEIKVHVPQAVSEVISNEKTLYTQDKMGFSELKSSLNDETKIDKLTGKITSHRLI